MPIKGSSVRPSTAEQPPSTAEQPPSTAEQPSTSNFHFHSPTTPPQPPSILSAFSTPHPPPQAFASRSNHAVTGYVAALIDFSRRDGNASLDGIARDVHSLITVLDESPDDEGRVEAVLDAVESGGFDHRLVALVKMVAAKAKGLEAVEEVLKEFWRAWREMTAAAEVEEEMEMVVATEEKMRVEELARIARELHRARGVLQVKVKHLYYSEG